MDVDQMLGLRGGLDVRNGIVHGFIRPLVLVRSILGLPPMMETCSHRSNSVTNEGFLSIMARST